MKVKDLYKGFVTNSKDIVALKGRFTGKILSPGHLLAVHTSRNQ